MFFMLNAKKIPNFILIKYKNAEIPQLLAERGTLLFVWNKCFFLI